jgi:hypothetical protein
MRCPRCGAWSEVKETRADDASFKTKRRRICANKHLFTTYEVLPAMLASARDQRGAIRAARASIAQHRRNQAIVQALQAGASTSAVAHAHGLTDARIRQVRDTFTDPTTPDTNGITDRGPTT